MPRSRSNQNAARPLWRCKSTWLSGLVLALFGLLASCAGTRTLMQTAPSTSKGTAAQPAITAASLDEWNAQARQIYRDFELTVYGHIPENLSLAETNRIQSPGLHFDETATLEFVQFSVLKDRQKTGREFGLVLVIPENAKGPTPIIAMQNFCPNHNVIPHADVPRPENLSFDCSVDGMIANIFGYFFGRYITTPPIAEIMKRGYALAVMYPSEFVPDSRDDGQTVLDHIFADQPKDTRTGALAAWAVQASMISNYLNADPRFGAHIAYGHSRFGKSALLAAAINPTIDSVIAHQSGTGGASLTRDKPGETLADITEGYPFWFSQKFASFASREDDLPVDQHHLLALIAPRPILLGNAKRDVWSDPEGAFRASQAASKVYGFYGSEGLRQEKLTAFDQEADIAFWMRPGTHGVVKEDWPAFLEFLDAHFK